MSPLDESTLPRCGSLPPSTASTALYRPLPPPFQPPRLQTLQPRGREGLSRNLEGELGEDQHPQRAPRYVNALPERVGSQENPRACLPEASQQVVTLPLALHEQGPPAADRVAHGV